MTLRALAKSRLRSSGASAGGLTKGTAVAQTGSTAQAGTTPVVEVADAPAANHPEIGTGVLLMLGSCISLQVGAALAVTIFPVLGPLGTTSGRFLFAAVIVCAVFRPRFWRWNWDQWKAVLSFGLVLATMNSFFYMGIDRLPLGIAVSLEFIGPLMLAGILSRKLRDFGWILLAAGGISLFFFDDFTGGESLDPVGVGFIMVAAFCWALYIVCGAWLGQQIPGTGGIAGAFAVGAIALIPFGAAAIDVIIAQPNLVFICLGVGLLPSAIPYTLEFMALRRIPKPVFGILLSLEPVFAALAAWLLLGQTLSSMAVLAICLVVLASAGSTLGARVGRKNSRSEKLTAQKLEQ